MRRLANGKGHRIPNGPVGFPVIGSFPFLSHYPELTLDYWAKKFGPLYSMWLGNQLFVVVSDPLIAKDLLITNGTIFSSRKEMFIKSKTIFHGRGITVMPYDARWRRHRKIANTFLNGQFLDDHTEIFDYEAKILVRELFRYGKAGTEPLNPQPHAGRCSLNTMLTIVFGIRTDTLEHPLVGHALRLSREFMNCTGPVSNLVDFVPLLQRLPNSLTNRAKKLHKDLVDAYGGMINEIEKRMSDGQDVPRCLVKTLVEAGDHETLDRLDKVMICSAFMIGGVESTASIVQWFSAIMPSHPDIQEKAHAELDRVVGRNRLPTVNDEKDLPYVRAIIKEVERCHNPFWLSTPHVNTEDFTYQGQFIPKDTVVILNTYTMHHNAEHYSDPFKFNPDRYLNDHMKSSESARLANVTERDHWTFGAGRRICPAITVAEHELWLAISRMLWAFKMEQVPGEPIDLKEYDGLSGRSPVPFRIQMIPRDHLVAEVLEM
ncbi:hypothetical protein BS47DRAFT_1290846 [Hydnum rufescens UP504]|uniref:Cytochrome P450 n=1 Tax=Hydnum rufescens UP504 TaxID=1448309 RepID=A0A9P6E0U9_9AGAM|nr:hypothetical protein BS47DRAFT_1290846 [Hydnum rufescens UP504]